jgi:hypothetical protein
MLTKAKVALSTAIVLGTACLEVIAIIELQHVNTETLA